MDHACFPLLSPESTFLRASRHIAVAALSIAMSGCGQVYMSQESSRKIKSIEINPIVTVPDKPDVDGAVNVGRSLMQDLLSGYSSLPRNVGYQFGAYMDANDVKVDEIVLRTFRRYLKEQGHFELREGADATLELAVIRYGFKMPAFDITKNMRSPELHINATLRSKDSTVLSSRHEFLMRGSEFTHAHSIQTLWGNPRLVERSLEEASCVITYLLLSELHPARSSSDGSPGDEPGGPVCDPVVHVESAIECKPGVGCVNHKTETWEFRPSRDPKDLRGMCAPDVGCADQ